MKKGWKVFYEWDAEWCDSLGDIIDHRHADTLAELKSTTNEIDDMGTWFRLVLVRDLVEPHTGWLGGGNTLNRSWCYVTKDGVLPETTDGGHKIPKKYLKEFEDNKEWASRLGDRIDWETNLENYWVNKNA